MALEVEVHISARNPLWPSRTCPFLDDLADLPAEEDVHMVENELDDHRLDPHFHEGRRAAEAG